MEKLTLIYFKGCPNAKEARYALLETGLPFDEVCQDELSEDDAMKKFSSPTILYKNEILFGARTGDAGGCTLGVPTAKQIKEKIALK